MQAMLSSRQLTQTQSTRVGSKSWAGILLNVLQQTALRRKSLIYQQVKNQVTLLSYLAKQVSLMHGQILRLN